MNDGQLTEREAQWAAALEAKLKRASYRFERHGDVLALYDQFSVILPTPTITNDAEAVIADLARWPGLLDGKRVIYRDTVGRWDELVVRDRQFAGFRLMGAASLEEALANLQRRSR